jgi:hypothetical protein
MHGADANHPLAHLLEQSVMDMIGTRFRPQGRDAEGCDCLGLIHLAALGAGLRFDIPHFPLRGLAIPAATAFLEQLGCRRLTAAATGDILLQAAATLQVHLAMKVSGGLVEAHAGLRCVVFRPVDPEEVWHSAWRLPLGGK